MNNNKSLAINIISIANLFYKEGKKSFMTLLNETTYEEQVNEVLEDDLAVALAESSDKIDAWFKWSENKRELHGWYLKTNNNRLFEVGRLNHTGTVDQYMEFSNRRIACAVFIKKEIDSTRTCS